MNRPTKPISTQVGAPSMPPSTTGSSIARSNTFSIQQNIQALRDLTTPQWMKVGLGLVCLSAILSALASMAATDAQREAFRVLQKDTAPSILNAQRIKDSLADMDANVANDLIQGILTPTANQRELEKQTIVNGASMLMLDPDLKAIDPNNPDAISFILADPGTQQPTLDPKTQKIVSDGFEYRQNRLAGWLIKVSKNITYAEEWEPIWQIQYGLGNYLELIQQAKDFQSKGDSDNMRKTYRQAISLMDTKLLPAADRLIQVNYEQLNIQYEQQQIIVFKNLGLVLLFGIFLMGSLIWLQLFLRYWTNRYCNIPLLIATMGAAFSILYTGNALLRSDQQLRVAGQDAFPSIYSLRQVRALAYMANASESRYLLDRAFSGQHETDFLSRTRQILHSKIDVIIEPKLSLGQGEKVSPDVAEGLVATALNNVTFKGEAEALSEMLIKWNQYLTVDKIIRKLVASGRLNDAIALCVGYGPEQSNALFAEFREANQKVFTINQNAFDESIDRGTDIVAPNPILGMRRTPIAFGLVALLSFIGLRPRMKEYAD
jgi:hypothetical protein